MTWSEFKATVEALGVCDTDILRDIDYLPRPFSFEGMTDVAVDRYADPEATPPCMRVIIWHRLPCARSEHSV